MRSLKKLGERSVGEKVNGVGKGILMGLEGPHGGRAWFKGRRRVARLRRGLYHIDTICQEVLVRGGDKESCRGQERPVCPRTSRLSPNFCPRTSKSFARALQEVDLALLVREMREDAGWTQTELARKVGTTQSVIARLENAEYSGHSLTMLERIAAVCGVTLKLRAERKPDFDREVALV